MGETKYFLMEVDKLIPYTRNARTHSEVQIAQIAASIKEFGFLSPVIISKDNTILCGHGRYYAAQRISAGATFTYTNCNFEQNTYNNTDGSDNYYLNSYSGTGTIVFENCYMDGVLVTEENVDTLFQIDGVTVVVNNK